MRGFPQVAASFILLLAAIGCGVAPQDEQEMSTRPRKSPTPYPTRSVTASGFQEADLPPQYLVSYSGPYWVQLNDLENNEVSIVVGIVPTQSARDLEAAVEGQMQDLATPAKPRDRESGSIDSQALGRMLGFRTQFDDEIGTRSKQVALFGTHPADGCLVIARSEYPSEGADDQAKLDELVAIADVIAPGL